MKYHTLAVIDEDGSIAGNRGKVLVSSQAIECPGCGVMNAKIQQGVLPVDLLYQPRKGDKTMSFPDGKLFEKRRVTLPPFEVWVRVK